MNRKQRRAQAKKSSQKPQTGELFALALRLHQSGNMREAAELYDRILNIDPKHAKSLCNLGAIFMAAGSVGRSIPLYRKAVLLEPSNPGFTYNLAAALAVEGMTEEAIALYEKTISLKPDYVEAWNNLGGLYKADNQLEKAEQAFRQAVFARPDYREAYYNLCRVLLHQGRDEEARALMDSMITHYPEDALLKLKLIGIQPMIPESMVALELSRKQLEKDLNNAAPVLLDERLDDLLPVAAEPSFHLNYQGFDNLKIRRCYAALFRVQKPEIRNRKSEVFRVGILVTDRHEGIFLKIMGGIINHWVDQYVNLTIIASPSGLKLLRKSITNASIAFLAIPTHHFRATLDTIRRAAFDALFYWEVGSDPLNYFLPFFKPAPTQCTAWGTADTTGIPAMDYFISSHLQEPENAQSLYSEKLILFEHIPCWFERPVATQKPKTRADFGLSRDDHLYIVPQHPFKIHPEFDALIAAILHKDIKGKVVLIHDVIKQPGEKLLQRLKRCFPDIVDRIVLLPRQDEEGYCGLLALADVMLDPLHFGGGATTLESLAFGTPVVTWPGTHLRGRSTLACYKAMGFMELVAYGAEDYVNKAIRLGTEVDYRAEVQRAILAKNNCLYANGAVIAEFAQFFLSLRPSH